MPNKIILGIALAICFLMPRLVLAQTETYRLDRPHTQVLFSVSHLGFSRSYGRFTDFDGTFTLNRGKLEGSSVHVSIRTGSVTMDDADWTDAVKGEGYFDVAHYPVMTFQSTKVARAGPDTADVFGNLTLLGVTKPAKFAVTLNKTGRHPFKEEYVAGLSGNGVINRSDFGMTGGLPLVGDEVQIHLEIEGNRIPQPEQDFYNR